MKRAFLRSALLGATLALTACRTPSEPQANARESSQTPHRDATPTGADPYHGMIQYRAKDAKQAIVHPTLLSAEEAVIAPGTKVIGVFVKGEARAYPLFVLNNHQIVNDQVGGVPLSASW